MGGANEIVINVTKNCIKILKKTRAALTCMNVAAIVNMELRKQIWTQFRYVEASEK
jgi:hypothetical protein